MNYPWIAKANTLFLYVLGTQFLLSIFIGFFTNTLLLGAVVSVLIISLPLLLIFNKPFAFSTRLSLGIAIQLMTALHIQQAMGLTEIHFEIFVVLAFLSVYRDWRVILASTLTVAVHHILFFSLQMSSKPFYIFEQSHLAFYILLVHAAFAIAEGGILMYIAKQAHHEMKASFVLSHSVEQILRDPKYVDLNCAIDSDNESLQQFSKLIEQFKTVIGQAKQVSDEVLMRVSTVQDISAQVSSGSAQNAENLSHVSHAINEMNQTVSSVADSSNTANSIAQQSRAESIEAKRILESNHTRVVQLKTDITQTSKTIENLANRCNHIEEVMGAIKAVSEQTNLLALNAAIESARAGEHGRGFAVVADEVRKLATKTRENADEISKVAADLIADANTSVEQMRLCINEVDNAGNVSVEAVDIIQSIVIGFEKVSDNIASVATATEQQSATSSTITHSTQEVTQAADNQQHLAEQAQSELVSLSQQLSKLSDALSKFKLI